MAAKQIDALTDYRLLGKTGLKVSPLTLGAMSFGWGADREAAKQIFDRYLEAGGNIIDTADMYSNGESEAWLGDFIQESRTRDQVVLSTKFSFNALPGNPNAGGNGRKNIHRALDGSLKRLKTDYIDLYYLHAWDTVTPVEEVMATLNDLVRSGKVLHIGFSDVPAWYAARAQTIAELRGYERLSALQLEYSLVSRNLEREHLPLARELGIAICPWSPLASGFLTGKYQRTSGGLKGEGRIKDIQGSGNPVMEKFTSERNWKILDGLVAVSNEIGKTPSEVALNWVANRPGIYSTLIGASKLQQLEANLKSLDFELPDATRKKLDELSKREETELDHFFGPVLQGMINGNARVRKLNP